MARFKELARIERAVRDGDSAELQWALSYSRGRLEIAPKSQRKYWSDLSAKIAAALSSRAG